MGDELFSVRRKKWSSDGELMSFNLACVAEGLDTVQSLSDQNIGWEEVEKREGEYESWDPDILKVDIDAENGYFKRLESRGHPITFLSEEAGRVEINENAAGGMLYAVCDPFDGSYLFKHGIPDFWYSSMALYNPDFTPASCAVGDCTERKIAFANDTGAYLATLDGDSLVQRVKLDKSYREKMGRPDVTQMEGASIESYAMKPKKFLVPLVDEYRDFMLPFKFFLPNGGPYAFADVAEGKIDCYFARQQPYVDVFSGVFIAQQAGAVVTDFEGNPVKPHDDVKTLWDVVASTNRKLHDELLESIAACKKKMK